MADRADKCAEELSATGKRLRAYEKYHVEWCAEWRAAEKPSDVPNFDAWLVEKLVAADDDRELLEAAKNLLNACLKADAAEDLPPEIDGSLLDAVRTAIERKG